MRIVAFGQALIRKPVAWTDEIRELVAAADAVVVNFEGCMRPPGAWPMKTKTVHPAHDGALPALRELGVTHLSIANNHVWDFGHAGIVHTRAGLAAAGFAVAGAGVDRAEASAPAIRNGVALLAADLGPTPDWARAGTGPGVAPLTLTRVLGLPGADRERLAAIAAATGDAGRQARRVAVGYDGAPEGETFYGLRLAAASAPTEMFEVDEADLDRLAASIDTARGDADIVLVSLHYHHWAPDWRQPPGWLAPLARRIAGLGADAVVLHGPPVAYDGYAEGQVPIAPGLGNLVFHTARGPRYDAAGLPVWRGGALVMADGGWSFRAFDALRP